MSYPNVLVAMLVSLVGAVSCQSDCATQAEDARLLVQSFQACTTETVCTLVAMNELLGDSCASAFQCVEAFPEGFDGDAFVEQATPINTLDCAYCSEAKCRGVEDYVGVCNENTGLCEARLR